MYIKEETHKREFETVLPMINIVFLLLIFFMLAGAFVKPDALPVIVPESSFEKQADLKQITIIMTADKRYAIDSFIYDEEGITRLISDYQKNDDKILRVLLKADKAVKSKDLLATMNFLSDAGLESIQLMSLKKHSH